MMSRIPEHVCTYIGENEDITGADLARSLNIPDRTARRYVQLYKEENRFPPPLLRAAVWDIEVSSFGTEGYSGVFIMVCILPLGSDEVKVIKLSYEDAPNDKHALLEARNELAKYDILIGHNSAAFDENWMNSKLMYYGLPLMRTHLRFDTYQVAKALAIKTSKSLGNLLDFFKLPGEKTTIYKTSWSDIYSRDKEEFDAAIESIEYHCKQDVIGTRELFNRLYRYALTMGSMPFKLSKARIAE